VIAGGGLRRQLGATVERHQYLVDRAETDYVTDRAGMPSRVFLDHVVQPQVLGANTPGHLRVRGGVGRQDGGPKYNPYSADRQLPWPGPLADVQVADAE
jgi:hypothetical protein